MTDARPTIDAGRFRKKPVLIEAFQLTRELIEAHLFDKQELPFGVRSSSATYHPVWRTITHCSFSIKTLDGRMPAEPGDWITRNVQGELYPCKPDAFEATYEPDALPSEPQPPLNDEVRADLARIAENPVPGDGFVRMQFHGGLPSVEEGWLRCFIVVTEKSTKNTMPAYYLNKHPLEHDDCICASESDHSADGCPVTGWFYDEANFEYENCYYRIESPIVAWAELPTKDDAISSAAKASDIHADRATLLRLLDSSDATIAGLTAELAGKDKVLEIALLPHSCPGCGINWWLFPPVNHDDLVCLPDGEPKFMPTNGYRCVECKREYRIALPSPAAEGK